MFLDYRYGISTTIATEAGMHSASVSMPTEYFMRDCIDFSNLASASGAQHVKGGVVFNLSSQELQSRNTKRK
jgi:hypothetical protein